MRYDGIFESLLALRDEERAPRMSAICGINSRSWASHRLRETPIKKFCNRKEKIVDFDFVIKCFKREEREFQYAGVDYLLAIQDCLVPENLQEIETIHPGKILVGYRRWPGWRCRIDRPTLSGMQADPVGMERG